LRARVCAAAPQLLGCSSAGGALLRALLSGGVAAADAAEASSALDDPFPADCFSSSSPALPRAKSFGVPASATALASTTFLKKDMMDFCPSAGAAGSEGILRAPVASRSFLLMCGALRWRSVNPFTIFALQWTFGGNLEEFFFLFFGGRSARRRMWEARALVLPLLLVFACVRGGEQQRDADGADHDDWHPRQRFAKTPAPISTSHIAAVNSAARLLALGKGDEALQICRNVLRSDVQHAPCLTMLARVYAARGDAAAARRSS
jgi:hypothetical protein